MFSFWSHFSWYCRHCTSASTGVLVLQNFLQNQWVGFCLWSFVHISWQDRHCFTHNFSQLQLIWGSDSSPCCQPVVSRFRGVIFILEQEWQAQQCNRTVTVLLLAKAALLEAQSKEIKTTFPHPFLLWAEQNNTNGRPKSDDFHMATLASKSSGGWKSCSLKIISAPSQNWINSNNKTQVIPLQSQLKSWQFCFPCYIIPKGIIGLKDCSRAQAKNLQLLLMCYSISCS